MYNLTFCRGQVCPNKGFKQWQRWRIHKISILIFCLKFMTWFVKCQTEVCVAKPIPFLWCEIWHVLQGNHLSPVWKTNGKSFSHERNRTVQRGYIFFVAPSKSFVFVKNWMRWNISPTFTNPFWQIQFQLDFHAAISGGDSPSDIFTLNFSLICTTSFYHYFFHHKPLNAHWMIQLVTHIIEIFFLMKSLRQAFPLYTLFFSISFYKDDTQNV